MGCGGSNLIIDVVHRPLPKQTKSGKPIVYMWPGSAPCRAVFMTARAVSVDIQICKLDVFKDEHKSKEFKKVNPECVIPTLVDGDHKLWDSHEIMKDLVDRYTVGNKLYPKDADIRPLVEKFLTYDQEEAYPAISEWIYPQVFGKLVPDSSKKTRVENVLQEIDELVTEQAYIATDHVTLSDLSIIATLTLLELKDWDFTPWEHLQKWRNKIKDLPYYSECNKGLEDWKFYLHVKNMEENEE